MATLLSNRCLKSTFNVLRSIQQRNFSNRQKVSKFVEPDKLKKHMLAACEPYFKRVYVLPSEVCKGRTKVEPQLLPIEKIIVKEILEEIERNEFILIVQYNYTKFQSERVYKNTITKSGGTFHIVNNKISRETFRILNRGDLMPLFIGRNALITGKTENLPNVVNSMKKMPQFILLAGWIDNHVYDVKQLNAISLYPNLDQTRANLLSTLTTSAIDLSSNLEQYSKTLNTGNESDSAGDVGDKVD